MAQEPPQPPAYTCPWCDETADLPKKVMQHMESRHYQQWCNLALYPPIAGGVH
jgi:hypothetical protein